MISEDRPRLQAPVPGVLAVISGARLLDLNFT